MEKNKSISIRNYKTTYSDISLDRIKSRLTRVPELFEKKVYIPGAFLGMLSIKDDIECAMNRHYDKKGDVEELLELLNLHKNLSYLLEEHIALQSNRGN